MGTRAGTMWDGIDADADGELVVDVAVVVDVRIFTWPPTDVAVVALVAVAVETNVIGVVFFGLADICVVDARGGAPGLLICNPTDRVVLTGGTSDWLRPFDCCTKRRTTVSKSVTCLWRVSVLRL